MSDTVEVTFYIGVQADGNFYVSPECDDVASNLNTDQAQYVTEIVMIAPTPKPQTFRLAEAPGLSIKIPD